jgi:DNA-directed RNA polymerase beta' subunit
VKQVKYLESLHREGLKPQDAYVISKVPVIPPVFRPIVAMPNDPTQLMVADANKLYSHLMDINHAAKTNVLPSADPKYRSALYNAVGTVFGTHDVEDDALKGQAVKGFLTQISGKGSPKGGFFQRKLMFRTQDVSGRGTIVPDGSLHMNQIGLPEDMLWKMLDRMIVARRVRTGYDALSARAQTDKRTPGAREAMLSEIKERPFIFNRAPTLHRYSMVSGYAVPVSGKTIRMNPFAEVGLNADYDGDTLQIHTPVTPGAVDDAKKMLLSNLLLSDQSRDKLMVMPRMESVMGITQAAAAMPNMNKKVRVFNSKEEALLAYRRGEIQLTDPIQVHGAKTAEEKEAEEEPIESLPWTETEALRCFPPQTVTGYYP